MAEGNHFSSLELAAGELFQKITRQTRLGRAVTNWWAGSDSPAYTQLVWQKLPIGSASLMSFCGEIDGDPTAPWRPRNWNYAAVLGISREWADTVRGIPQDREAVAFIADNKVHVGVKPSDESDQFFGTVDLGSQGANRAAVAMRLGGGSLIGAMGRYNQASQTFHTPPSIYVIDEWVPISDLHLEYPGVPLT